MILFLIRVCALLFLLVNEDLITILLIFQYEILVHHQTQSSKKLSNFCEKIYIFSFLAVDYYR